MGQLPLRLSEDVERQVREDAAATGSTLTAWLQDAAERKLAQNKIDLDDIAEVISREDRGLLDRLAE